MKRIIFVLICFFLISQSVIYSKEKIYLSTNGIMPPLLDKVYELFKSDKDFILTDKNYNYEISLIFTNNPIKSKSPIISCVIMTKTQIIKDHYLLVPNDNDFEGCIKILIDRLKSIIKQ